MVDDWDRKVRRILEVAGEDRGELLQRILLALGEHEHSLDALHAALVDFGAVRRKRLAGLEALRDLDRLSRGDRRG